MAIRDQQRLPVEPPDLPDPGAKFLDRLAKEGRLVRAQLDPRALGPPLPPLSGMTLSEALAEDRAED